MTQQDYAMPARGSAYGRLDVATAFGTALSGFGNNAVVLIGAGIVTLVGCAIAALLCFVPLIIVGPLLTWGLIRVCLHAIDGTADFNTLFSGSERLGEILIPMIGLSLALFALAVPGVIVNYTLQAAGGLLADKDSILLPMFLQLGGSMFGAVWSLLVTSRTFPALYLLVERDLSITDSLTEAWHGTGANWVSSLLLCFALGIFQFFALVFTCGVASLVALPLGFIINGAAYRQIYGR